MKRTLLVTLTIAISFSSLGCGAAYGDRSRGWRSRPPVNQSL
ncbi:MULTISPECIES: hypothetical protein [Leptolyngbya]|nr:hypothetical protein [Leptolyngbya sp. FACHB-1624]